jgi:hypothetical protein
LFVAGFAAAWVRCRVWQVGFMVDKVAMEQVFSDYFDFPCQSSFQQLLHNHHHLSYGARWVLAAVPSGLTSLRMKKKGIL